MDWTGARMTITGRRGQLALPPTVAGPFRDGHPSTVDFVVRYAQDAMKRRHLDLMVVTDPDGSPLADLRPPPAQGDLFR